MKKLCIESINAWKQKIGFSIFESVFSIMCGGDSIRVVRHCVSPIAPQTIIARCLISVSFILNRKVARTGQVNELAGDKKEKESAHMSANTH